MKNNLYIPIDTSIYDLVECEKLVKRGDTLTLTVKVFTNGVLTDLTGQSIDLILKKSDGTLIENTLNTSNVANGVITIVPQQQSTLVSGLVSGELQIYDGNGQNSTNTFTFNVSTSLADDVIEVSKNDIHTLSELRTLIANGQVIISEYENSILAIGNSLEAIEALANIKLYIDTNLPALESENAKSVVNIVNLKNENDKAPGLTTSLKTENDKAPQLTSNLKTENDRSDINIPALETKNDTAEALKIALETDITNANNSKSALDTSKTNSDASKIALDASITGANSFVSAHGDIIDLDNRVAQNTAQLSDISKYLSPTGGTTIESNDSDLINNAFINNNKVILKSGTYYIDAVNKPILPQSDRILEFEKGAKIQVITNSEPTYDAIKIKDVENVTIIEPFIIGDRLTHVGTSGEWGTAITILGSKNVKIYNPQTDYCWGDGIYIGSSTIKNYCEDILIENPIANYCRRLGIAIISVKNITINNPKAYHIDGTDPMAGIDIEPNTPTEFLQNIVINNPYASNCKYGFVIGLHQVFTNKISIELNNPKSEDCINNGFGIFSNGGIGTGEITINDLMSKRSGQHGFLVREHTVLAPQIIFNNPVIIDPAVQGETDGSFSYTNSYYSAIAVVRYAMDTGTGTLGNTTIVHPTIIDTRTQLWTGYAFFVQDVKLANTVGVSLRPQVDIIDPLRVDAKYVCSNVWNGKLKDGYRVLTNILSGTPNLTDNAIFSTSYSNVGATSSTILQIFNDTIPIGMELQFSVVANYPLSVWLFADATKASAIKVMPFNDNAISSSIIGNSIKIKKIDATHWGVVELVGIWSTSTTEILTRGSTSNRPLASLVGMGFMYYDSTLQKPIWSNGGAWKDATGTAV